MNRELDARARIESALWPNGPVCPKCGHVVAYPINARRLGQNRPARDGLYKCQKCRRQFTVRIGTLFEGSKLPLWKWLKAVDLMKHKPTCAAMASCLGVANTTAWLVRCRLRKHARLCKELTQ